MYLFKDFKMSLLSFNFVIIYIIHKILVLLKNSLNYLICSILKSSFKEYNKRLFFFFSQHIMMESLSLEKENITKDIFLDKKELNYTAIKGIRNLFRLEK